MGDRSGIEWTDATWNPVLGCSVVSPGCKNCYAMRMAHRIAATGNDRYIGLTRATKRGPVWNGLVGPAPLETLVLPIRWRRPRRVFVNSMSDLFHEDLPDMVIDHVMAVMAFASQHTFQVLTKRSARMRAYMASRDRVPGCYWTLAAEHLPFPTAADHVAPAWPPPNVWLGVSVEDQRRADERVPDLLRTPAAVRFLSCEPLLGPVDLRGLWTYCPTHDFDSGFCVGRCPDRIGVDQVIAGGESGPGARPVHPDNVRSLRDQCVPARVAFFFKQWGEWAPTHKSTHVRETYERVAGRLIPDRAVKGQFLAFPAVPSEFDVMGNPRFDVMVRVGKKKAGALLDGRAWREFPEAA